MQTTNTEWTNERTNECSHRNASSCAMHMWWSEKDKIENKLQQLLLLLAMSLIYIRSDNCRSCTSHLPLQWQTKTRRKKTTHRNKWTKNKNGTHTHISVCKSHNHFIYNKHQTLRMSATKMFPLQRYNILRPQTNNFYQFRSDSMLENA